MEQRLSLVTLGVADLERSRRFYEDGLGWRRGNAHAEVVFFQIGCAILGLFSREALAADARLPGAGSGFGGITLAYNARSRAEVDAVLAEAKAAGARSSSPRRTRSGAVIPAISPIPMAIPGRSPGTRSGRSPTTAASGCASKPVDPGVGSGRRPDAAQFQSRRHRSCQGCRQAWRPAGGPR